MSLPSSNLKSVDTILHLIQSRYKAAKRAFVKFHVLSTSRAIRELILTLESQSTMPPRLRRSVSLFLRFNEQLAHARNGRNTNDELASGVSKSSIRYVSTSPEDWIGSASKSEGKARRRGSVRAGRWRENGVVGGVASGQHTWPTLLR